MNQPTPQAAAPGFHAKRLLYITTGGIQAMLLPTWMSWLRTHYPNTEVHSVLTPSARRFVGTTAVAAAGGRGLPTTDAWPTEPDRALHVDLATWPDAILVHPATMHFVARLSLGLADTPALLALQCTRAPIVICPSLPPNGHLNPAYQRHILELSERDNVTVLPPVNGVSITTGEEGIGTAAYLPHAISALEDLRTWTEPATA
ncbi:flavoprotein (plasmid) [Streptomyces sp. NBC_01558]|uniref:flavoprotein n=1 Tax=Streptomyces sp. NBC_01558 TaxID=2975878 RepID=UPI002DD8F71B|nr:flavoprotein [Streptomyces sp. NBC_01558]WSD82734.1 flavoprotein [Streptomyces sp. NBC_01558]